MIDLHAVIRLRQDRAGLRQHLKTKSTAYPTTQMTTRQNEDLILSLREQGYSYRRIAKEIGVSRQAVHLWLKRWHPDLTGVRKAPCAIVGCKSRVQVIDGVISICRKHKRKRLHKPTSPKTYLKRLLQRITERRRSECWIWPGPVHRKMPQAEFRDYGRGTKDASVRRIFYWHFIGDPGKSRVRCGCGVDRCVNPWHVRVRQPSDRLSSSGDINGKSHQAEMPALSETGGRDEGPSGGPTSRSPHPEGGHARPVSPAGWQALQEAGGRLSLRQQHDPEEGQARHPLSLRQPPNVQNNPLCPPERNGTPLGDTTRLSELRQIVRSEIDHLWKTGKLTKKQAYALLKGADIDGLSESRCKALVQEVWQVG